MVRRDAQEDEIRNLRGEIERLNQRFQLLSDLARRVTISLEIATALQEIIKAACELTEARYGALGIFDSAGRIQEFITHGISAEERAGIGDLPQGLGILGYLHEFQQSLRIADLSQHHRSVKFPPRHPPMKTFLGAPIQFAEAGLGNIYLTDKARGQEFTQEDETLLTLFSAQAAVVILNAKAHEEARVQTARAEQEERRLASLVDTSPVGILVISAEGTVVTANHEVTRIFGIAHQENDRLERYDRAVVYKRPDGSVYQPEELPLHRALYIGEEVRAEEVRFELSDGRTLLTLVNASPVYGADAQIEGAIAIVQDITPLEEVEKARNDFLGMVTHELRTPLSSIKGAAATILGSKRAFNEEEARELFQVIDEQADRLTDLVNNLLDISRIEAGALAVTPEPISLRQILEHAVRDFERSSHVQPIQLVVSEDLVVKADRTRVVQVLMNLLTNAAKNSPPSSPILVEATGGSIHITVHVRDQGRGISPEEMPHLFRKFSRIGDPSGTVVPGSGLGLAICKGVIEAHGGRIWAESPGPGAGATFSFTLPATRDVKTLPAEPRPQRVSKHGDRVRVLAVDDEPQALRLLRRSLDESGYEPVVTPNPIEVVGLVERQEPDLVLLDLMLPGITGFDLLAQIREFSTVPVIIVTAREAEEDMIRALHIGADDYIIKPFSFTELAARMEAVLRRRAVGLQPDVLKPFVLKDLSVNFAQRQVSVGGLPVFLTPTEYKLVYELASHAGQVLTHDQLLQRVWGPEYSGETELVRSMVRNLRRKLRCDSRHPRYIINERGVGYRMPRE